MVSRTALACVVAVIATAFGPQVPVASAAQSGDAGLNSRPLAAVPNADGRYIVLLRDGVDPTATSRFQRASIGFTTGRVFRTAVRGYVAVLTPSQRASLLREPDVQAVVPDEVIELAQYTPTGISRTGGRRSPMARINAVDDRSIDADVAIVDTGIDGTHPDLNVVGGIDCSTTIPTRWRDRHGHGTHVAGTVGARDDPWGVPGVAPGVRLWAVKILNDSGAGLLSWYVCGLDWIATQRDPADSSRPLIEAVNMSVTKWGRDDRGCGRLNDDILHAAICRVTRAGITVVAAAANDSGPASLRVPAAYNEVITVSALADTDGKSGGLGGRRCYSWGGYDRDDTFANFSNYGIDIDLIAPGKCIWSTYPGSRFAYLSGTSMAAPHVTGAAALYKATRPWATPSNVKAALQILGSNRWWVSTDPDSRHERLLDVSRLGAWGDYSVAVAAPPRPIGEAGGSVRLPVAIARTPSMFEYVGLSAQAEGPLSVSLDRVTLIGFAATSSIATVRVPAATPAGSYTVTITGQDSAGRTRRSATSIVVVHDAPTARPASVRLVRGPVLGASSITVRVVWPRATDPSSRIAGYQLERSVDGGAWAGLASYRGSVAAVARTLSLGHVYRFRVRARDAVGNWSSWAEGAAVQYGVRQDNSTGISYRYGWSRLRTSAASGGTTTWATRAGAQARLTFTASQVAIVAPLSRYRGVARIYVDGAYVGSANLYAARTTGRRVVWVRAWRRVATHTLEIRVMGTAGHPRVDFDALVVLR